MSAEAAARLAKEAAGAGLAAQQTAVAAFEYGYHADQAGAAPGERPDLAASGVAMGTDDMEV